MPQWTWWFLRVSDPSTEAGSASDISQQLNESHLDESTSKQSEVVRSPSSAKKQTKLISFVATPTCPNSTLLVVWDGIFVSLMRPIWMRGCSLLLNESFQQECRKVAGETAPVLNGGKKAVATMIRRCQCCNDSVSSFLVRSTSAV